MSKLLTEVHKVVFGEKKRLFQIFIFISMGIVVALIQFATFAAVFFFSDSQYFFSSAVAFCVAVMSSFVLQRQITFSKTTKRSIENKQSLVLFILYSFVNLSINQAVMYTGVDILAVNAFYSQLASMSFLAVINFIVYRFIFS